MSTGCPSMDSKSMGCRRRANSPSGCLTLRLGDASPEVDTQGTDAELGPLQRVAARRQAMCSSMPKGLVTQVVGNPCPSISGS